MLRGHVVSPVGRWEARITAVAPYITQQQQPTRRQVGEFAEMLTGRHGERLEDWMRDVDATGAAPLRSFANGLRTDLDAVVNGLTLPYSSGPVEGTVTRIILWNLICQVRPVCPRRLG